MHGRVLGGRYRLVSPLGQGGMGSVWRAEQLDLPKPVAIKLINPGQVDQAENRRRFEREARAAAQLSSLHIVDITDYGIDADTPFIVMKLLEGESLASRLRRKGKLSFEETLHVLSQVEKALTLAHSKKIVHRDLKPENIFIEGYQPNIDQEQDAEVVKVLDFGVAKILDSQSSLGNVGTCTDTMLGTPNYMSPEQINDSSNVDHRTDVWSFGVVAYECTTGRLPFESTTSLARLLDVIRGHVCKPPSEVGMVPFGFDDWFAQATACDLDRRFSTIKEAMASLRSIHTNRAVPKQDPPSSGSQVSTAPPTTLAANPERLRAAPEPAQLREPPSEVAEQLHASLAPVEPSSVGSPSSPRGPTARRRSVVLVFVAATTALGTLAYMMSSSPRYPISSTTTPTALSKTRAFPASACTSISPTALSSTSSGLSVDTPTSPPAAPSVENTPAPADVAPMSGNIIRTRHVANAAKTNPKKQPVPPERRTKPPRLQEDPSAPGF